MKKIFIFMICTVLLTGCSNTQNESLDVSDMSDSRGISDAGLTDTSLLPVGNNDNAPFVLTGDFTEDGIVVDMNAEQNYTVTLDCAFGTENPCFSAHEPPADVTLGKQERYGAGTLGSVTLESCKTVFAYYSGYCKSVYQEGVITGDITLKGVLSAKGDGSPYFCPYPESLKETGIPSFYISPVFGGNIFPVKMPDGTEKYLSSMMIFLDDTAESYRKDAPAEAEITFKSLAYDTGSVNSWVRVHVTPETISVSE